MERKRESRNGKKGKEERKKKKCKGAGRAERERDVLSCNLPHTNKKNPKPLFWT